MNDGERGVWIIRNEKLKYNRFVFTDENKEVVFEMILSDEVRSVLKTIGFAKLRNFIKSRIGAEHHMNVVNNLDEKPNHDMSLILRVIEGMGDEFKSIVGEDVAYKATGRGNLLGDLYREKLGEQYLFMRELQLKFQSKPLPGISVCKQFAYFKFPKQGPKNTRGGRDDLEYILMEQVNGKMVEHRKRSLVYAGGSGPAREDIRMYSLSLDKNPVITNVLNLLLNNYKPKYKDEFSYKYDIKRILEDGEIDMKTLKELLEEYYGISYSNERNLRDFTARNLLSELNKKGEQQRLVIIDQHPHHR
jgi:hypothetical protein